MARQVKDDSKVFILCGGPGDGLRVTIARTRTPIDLYVNIPLEVVTEEDGVSYWGWCDDTIRSKSCLQCRYEWDNIVKRLVYAGIVKRNIEL